VDPGRLPRTIAVTGLGTFVGAGAVERLLACEDAPALVGIDVRLPPRVDGRVRFHRVDLTRATAPDELSRVLEKERCEALLHAAFFTDPHPDRVLARALEVTGSLHVMNAAAAAGVRRLVVTSSAQVCGPHPHRPLFVTERHPLRPHPQAHAACDRAEVEALLQLFARRHPSMSVATLRPCWLAGPNVDTLVMRHLGARFVTTLLGYDPLLQLLHEDDFFDAVELALRSDASGAFHLSASGPLPVSTLLGLAGSLPRPVPHPLLYRLEHEAWVRRTGDPPQGFFDHLRLPWMVDADRAQRELGFAPRYTTQEAWMSFVVERRLRRYR
jgi:UDP-glucose 4-epimerase